ncbi:MAG: hypothetical protein ACXVAY_10220 [Mucilaginibacter sp.]
MIRELIKPIENSYLLNLPNEMIGKTVEIIAFEIENEESSTNTIEAAQNIQTIREKYARYPVISHDNFKFNRDEANDYE